MFKYDSIQEMVDEAEKQGTTISSVVLQEQSIQLEQSVEVLMNGMRKSYRVMEEAIAIGMKSDKKSNSGLSGGDAHKLIEAGKAGKTVGGPILNKVLTRALAVSEVNASMGRIVAAPTAGSCGILPAVLYTIGEENNIEEDKIVQALFTAAGIGMVIAKRATISGAEGGCQAECGSAAAMAAAAVVEIAGGEPQMAAHACAIALKSILGLVCDPVAGLVEVPCIKRNAMGAANAIAAADMALAGIESVIPADEVIDAMRSVGILMVPALKETAEGGLAGTPTARRLTQEIFGKKE